MDHQYFPNETSRLRREILRRVAHWYRSGRGDQIDQLPYEMVERGKSRYRCCIFKEREIVKYRTIAALGFSVEQVEDESRPLHSYADDALQRVGPPDGPLLTIFDAACDNCVRTQYSITDACHGCLARPCKVNCPKDCISIQDRRAVIDTERCINCGKCQKVCPYHAVIKMAIPCEESCPVDAIYRDEDGNERIDDSRCISCGKCMQACPFGAIMDKSQIVDVLRAIDSDRPVVAMCAPSIVGQFESDWAKIVTGLCELGFSHVTEVAGGADKTCRLEADEFHRRVVEADLPFMTTSCCPAYVDAVKKHLPELAPFISKTPTPMSITAQNIRLQQPEAITVFVGPCLAKRHEGMIDDSVDFVLTFEEIFAMLEAAEIDISECDRSPLIDLARAEGRGFGIVGGPSGAVRAVYENPQAIRPVVVNGLDAKEVKRLRKFATSGCPDGNLVEVITCEGGCVGGPAIVNQPRKTVAAIRALVDKSEK
jgi:[FeFe] hydrogenase (group B1/B3)